MEIISFIDVASYYQITGWAWRPDNASIKIQVSLLDSYGNSLATVKANNVRQDLVEASIGDGHYSFSFYGYLGGVTHVNFYDEETQHTIPVSYEQPENPEFSIINNQDYLLDFLINSNQHDTCASAVNYYFSDGKDSAKKLKELCMEHFSHKKEKIELLEFASGYGRVTRHIDRQIFNVTASDIHENAIMFVKEQFDVDTLQSNTNPLKFTSPSLYNVVFALSFFSHIPDSSFGNWLIALFNCLKKNGLLIFTTHGRVSNTSIKMTIKDSYGFESYSEQKDLNAADYGTTVVEIPYVISELQKRIGEYPILFYEGYWWKHQDLYIVKRRSQ